MRLGYKIGIGVVSGVAIGFVTYKLIYNYRIKSANDRFTPELQKENLIDNIIILKDIDNSEENRNIYRAMTLRQLTDLVNQISIGGSDEFGYSVETTSYYNNYSDSSSYS